MHGTIYPCAGCQRRTNPLETELIPQISLRYNFCMKQKVKLLDVIALTQELPNRDLSLGQVGTVMELLAPDVYEVEFTDNEGRAFAELALRADQLWFCIMNL